MKKSIYEGKRVACYIRVSTLEQANNGHSLKMQYDELTHWAKENGCIIHDYYIDDGFTATTLKRPALQKMLDEAGKYDMIIFIKLDRFSRGVGNYYRIMDKLKPTKNDWKAIFEDFDTTTTQGRTMINLYLTIAQQEAELASDRTKHVYHSRIKQGEFVMGNAPTGYKRVKINDVPKLQIDPLQAEYVRECFKHFLSFGSLKKTMVHTNEKYNRKAVRKTMKRILTNKIYIGTYAHKEIGEFPNFCEPLISEKDFFEAQNLLKKNAKVYNTTAEKRHTYIFSGMLVCNKCGRRLSGKGISDKRRKDRGRRKYYTCYQYCNLKQCDNSYTLTELKLEKYLLENVRNLLENKIISYNVEKDNTSASPLVGLKAKKKKIESKLDKVKDMYYEETIRKEDYEKDFKQFNKELNEVIAEIEKHQAEEKHFDISTYTEFLKQNFEAIYDTMSEDEKRRLWLSVIDKINIEKGIIAPVFF